MDADDHMVGYFYTTVVLLLLGGFLTANGLLWMAIAAFAVFAVAIYLIEF